MYRMHRPDITLMDVRMPHMDGLETTRVPFAPSFPLRGLFCCLPSMRSRIFIMACRSGSKGYLLKDAAPEEGVSGDSGRT